jgi:hypothetical protein
MFADRKRTMRWAGGALVAIGSVLVANGIYDLSVGRFHFGDRSRGIGFTPFRILMGALLAYVGFALASRRGKGRRKERSRSRRP